MVASYLSYGIMNRIGADTTGIREFIDTLSKS